MGKKKSLTREYLSTLKDFYNEEGLLAAIGYDLTSTMYSMGNQVVGFWKKNTGIPLRPNPTSGSSGEWRKGSIEERMANEKLRELNDISKERKDYLLRYNEDKNLSEKVITSMLVGFIGAGLILFAPNMTGNAIGNLNQTSLNWTGGILFALGLIGSFIMGKKYRR